MKILMKETLQQDELLVYTFNFTAKTYVYGPVGTSVSRLQSLKLRRMIIFKSAGSRLEFKRLLQQ